jgi:hypothetical protein
MVLARAGYDALLIRHHLGDRFWRTRHWLDVLQPRTSPWMGKEAA